jgi:branched-chain amino acid aminotransferase
VIYEPEIASALMGITRASVIAIAKDLGLQVVSKRLTRDDIYIADETFFSGTAAEVTPVRELDGRTIGSGSRGPITGKIQSAFFDIVNGRNKKYAKWLSPIAPGKAKGNAKKAKSAGKTAAKKAKK